MVIGLLLVLAALGIVANAVRQAAPPCPRRAVPPAVRKALHPLPRPKTVRPLRGSPAVKNRMGEAVG